mmetsp:Transcript_99582/g.257329  ORF Transcript_99582/g.257329 Transcript_99582/m.257329 type:complete len:911 (-) Transcript_99582:257-2989(-)
MSAVFATPKDTQEAALGMLPSLLGGRPAGKVPAGSSQLEAGAKKDQKGGEVQPQVLKDVVAPDTPPPGLPQTPSADKLKATEIKEDMGSPTPAEATVHEEVEPQEKGEATSGDSSTDDMSEMEYDDEVDDGEKGSAALPDTTEKTADGLPSVGSALHASGQCSRCCFFLKNRCRNGVNCQFCHLDHERRSRGRGCRGRGTSSKEAKAAEKNAGAVKEHGLKVALEAPGESAEDAAWGGGLAVPCAVLKAKPTYREAVAEVSFVASGDVLVNPCKEHSVAGALQRPTAVSVGGRLTEAQCCKPQGQGDGRCRACRWKKVKHPHTVKVRIIIDIIRMAEIRDWASVNKRITITTPADARGAVAVLLNARPHLETDMIMKIFEGACGHQGEVDFPVRVDGATALHVAVEESHHAAVQSLLKRNLDPLVRNSAGETPLHAAARGGLASAPQIAQLLLDSARCAWRGEDKHEDDMQAARKSLLDAQDAQGRTVLHLAATSDQQSLLTMLLKLKADPKLRNKAGGTALHAAAASGGLACLTELLGDKAVDVNLAMGEEKDLGATALHLACQRCHTEVAELLLSKGASARKVTKAGSVEQQALNLLMEGATSFARPSDIHGVVAVAKRLLKGGGTPKDVVTAAGKTLCSLALWGSGDASASEAASELLALLGSAGLDRAEALGAELLNVCRLELTRGTQGDKRDDRRLMLAQTPGAAASDLPDAVALALRLGADPNTADAMKDTALHILLQYPMKRRMLPSDRAAGEAVACAVQKLLERRAEVTAANKKGGTPLALAKRLSELGSHYGNSWAALMAGEPQTPPPAPRRQTHTESKGATDAESASKAEAASSAASEASASRTKSHPSHSREVPKSSMLPSLSLSPNGSPKTSPQPTAREKLPSVVQLPVLGPSIGNAQ